MARYYFDLRDGTELFRDEKGVQLPTLRAGEIEAARALGGLARDHEPAEEAKDMAIEVRNDEGPLFQGRSCVRNQKDKALKTCGLSGEDRN